MTSSPAVVLLDAAVDLTRTGDIWIFRGCSPADRAIRMLTNAPVNHVGMAVVLDDLPPLMWHAELGRSLPDAWTGTKQRGVQLHDLRGAVTQWRERYRQEAWLRQLTPDVSTDMEDAVLRTIARWDGTPFPTTAALAGRWLRGRAGVFADPRAVRARRRGRPFPAAGRQAVYCAEIVAVTYQDMGLLGRSMPSMYFDPGAFWSGDHLTLAGGYRLGEEIAI
ncbi:MAG: hypothetical protein ABI746_10860, partial [Dermatophilaceae bacterium]